MADTSTSSSTAPSDAEREEMLDRMLTRLALADDDKLEPLLVRILPYSISSLASPSPSIRKSFWLLSCPVRASLMKFRRTVRDSQ
ncbi:hypothetical protein ZIOFF_008778 [Zingiber officinale]|uniref:Proteasome component Ecm29 N-terminal domain-containing protein n=1 Tax=Zingiber officinale TaxID=94328 RepID=A0A8J5HZD4_ZINOF|nr:hypothetical protein ZIOFF_008778 [Zingiber officinale]